METIMVNKPNGVEVYVYFFGELLGAAGFKKYRDADEYAYKLGQERDTHAV